MAKESKSNRPAQPSDRKSATKAPGITRRRLLLGAGAVAVGGIGVYLATTNASSPAKQYTYEIVHRYPHDERAFTQGLVYYRDDILYEGTGRPRSEDRYGSELREVRLQTGHAMHERHLPDPLFGEGVCLWNDTLFQLTWQNQVGFVFDRATFQEQRRFNYEGEGWGLTHNGQHLIMSNGSSTLTFRDPDDFRVVRSLKVTDGWNEIKYLNELEYIEGEIYANVWMTDRIARISPETGQVLAWLDLSGLTPNPPPTNRDAVLNGIAYDPQTHRLFVTGKLWSELFEIRQVLR
jgi:glutamine cyclotransferase